jgi:archaellum biogenesis protein FlaJ (TadC family)
MLNTIISIISLIFAIAQVVGFPTLNSTMPLSTDWYPRLEPLFGVVPVAISLIFVFMLYFPKKHRYDDFIKNDNGYKKWFWISFMVSLMVSFMIFWIQNSNTETSAIVICIICSIIGAPFGFIGFAAIGRVMILSLRHYPLSFRPF